ncbi:hypothetical protein PUN28_004971 [Cardiocondyla obscurior]|uniref:CHK kinase-like domain-containing protein n=1 Tax=Cardiocondyla obscurior TaxID=286306 RepID=A0AAW2GIB1_9HYME
MIDASAALSFQTIKQFQTYLRKYENDDKLIIHEAVDKPGSKLGDNYTSLMIRTKVVGTRGDGSPYSKTFMTKIIQPNKNISSIINLSELFHIEKHAYTKVLPVFGPFGPSCIYADENTIIMEDLAEKGYVNCERRNYLDLDHTVFALKKLAKFHAVGLGIKFNNPKQFDTLTSDIKEMIYRDDSKTAVMRSCTESYMKSIIQYLDIIEPRTEAVETIKDYIVTNTEKMYDMLRPLFVSPKRRYETICHGDPWTNNLLFLHNNDGKIIDLKLVDYQILRYTSVTTDFLYFMYSSVRSSLIERSFESLVKIYHNELLNELRRLHVHEKILAEFGAEWLEAEFKIYSLYGLIIGCAFINPILAEEDELKKFQTINFMEDNLAYENYLSSIMNQKKCERVKTIVLHFYKRFHQGIIDDDIEPIPVTD